MEIKLTKENSAEVLAKSGLILIDFFATWCGPCKMLSPLVEKLSDERTDITVCVADVDEYTELAIKHGVEVIPTLLVMENGKVLRKTSGYMSYEQLEAFVDGK